MEAKGGQRVARVKMLQALEGWSVADDLHYVNPSGLKISRGFVGEIWAEMRRVDYADVGLGCLTSAQHEALRFKAFRMADAEIKTGL